MTRPATQGFQKPIHTAARRNVKIAAVQDSPDLNAISCTCGWVKTHARKKVREDAAEAHLTKKHGGIGVWL